MSLLDGNQQSSLDHRQRQLLHHQQNIQRKDPHLSQSVRHTTFEVSEDDLEDDKGLRLCIRKSTSTCDSRSNSSAVRSTSPISATIDISAPSYSTRASAAPVMTYPQHSKFSTLTSSSAITVNKPQETGLSSAKADNTGHYYSSLVLPAEPPASPTGKKVAADNQTLQHPASVQTDHSKGGVPSVRSYFVAACLCGGFIGFEVSKNLLTYQLMDDDGRYPIDGSLLVAAAELLKLVLTCMLTLAVAIRHINSLRLVHISYLFAVPAMLFALNSNIYMVALGYVAPPVWTVLIQGRILLTALVYRTLLGRHISLTRWSALVALTIGVVLSQLKPDFSGLYPSPTAFLLALVACSISVASSLAVELLLKHHSCPFFMQQFQLYFYGFTASQIMWYMQPSGAGVVESFAALTALDPHRKVSRLCIRQK